MRMQFQDLAKNGGLFVDGDWVESKDQDPDGDTRLLQLADVGDGEFKDKSSRFMTSEKAKKLKCTYLEPGDVMIARMPDPLGRACIFPGATQPCVTVVDVAIMRPNPRLVHTPWLKHAINSDQFRSQMERKATGTTRKRISRGNLGKLEIDLPPLPEQKRIAAILDKADEIRRKRAETIRLTEELLKSAFLEMFGDPATNPKGWEVKKLGEVFELMHGHAFKSENFKEAGEYVLLTPGNFFEKGGFRDRGDKQKYHDAPVPPEYVLDTGDILVAMTEQAPGLLGSPILVPESGRFLHNQRLGKVIKLVDVESNYIVGLMNTAGIRARIQHDATGTKVKHTSPKKIGQIEVGIPPSKLQTEYASLADRCALGLHRQEEQERDLLSLASVLTQRAFRGEL